MTAPAIQAAKRLYRAGQLVSGRLAAQTAFGDSVGLTDDQLESAWQAFIQSR